MIENITIHSFKSLKNVSVEIKPVTVFIGLNSSGKSSVLQALEILKQSTKPEFNATSFLKVDGPLINLGTFENIVFQQEEADKAQKREANEVLFGIEGQREQSLPAPFGTETRYSYGFSVDKRGLEHQKCTITSGTLILAGKSRRGIPAETPAIMLSNGQLLFSVCNTLGVPFSYNGSSGGPFRDLNLDALISGFLQVIQQDLQDFFMVPAIRGTSSPSYPLDSEPSEDLMDVADLHQQAVKFSSTVVYKSPAIERKINKWINRITNISIRARTIPDKQAAIEAYRRIDVNIVNEGFGSNQLVHLFAQIATAPQHALIGIEEPESHLHPKAQSELAKVLIEIANEEKKNLILTTHSEHILYRILLEVARGSLKPEDLAIYHFRLSDDGATSVEKLNVDKKGRLDKGIPDFFETDLDEFKDFLETLKA